MDSGRPTLPQRVTAVVHAKQFLVFLAIGLYALDFAVPIASAWLYRREPLAELLRNTWGPLADAVAARSAVIAAFFVVYLLVGTWLRAATASASGPHVLRSSSASGSRRYSQAEAMGTAKSSAYKPMARKTRNCLACRTAVTRWGSVGRPESIAWEYIALACRGAAAAHRGYHEDMRLPRAVLIFLVLSWILVVLYPDPGVLVRSVRNTLHPQIDPAAVRGLAARLPNDPKAVEAYVLDRAVPYAYDWQSAGVPWYFPTTREALRVGRGDCESRAVVLASVLSAKGIPNELRMSFDHIWVDYPGKVPTASENEARVISGRGSDGWSGLRWPADIDLRRELRSQLAIYWDPMPNGRKALLFAGLAWIA